MNKKTEKNAVLIAFIRMILLFAVVAATVTTTTTTTTAVAAAPIWSQSSDKLNDFMFWIAYLLSP